MQPVSGHQRADRWRCLSYCACHATCIFADLLHSCHRFCNCHKTLTFGSLLARCKIHCACPGKWWFKRPKVVRTRCAFIYIYIYIYIYHFHNFTLKRASRHSRVHFLNRSTPKSSEVVFGILTSRCASRHRSVRFFNSSTSKSARNLKCF